MKVNEAYKELGLADGTPKEEAKKAFKKLAAKYHPDVNKEPGAEDNFKKINEAWRVVDTGELSTREEKEVSVGGWGFNIQDLINNFTNPQRSSSKKIYAQDIKLEQTLSFKESVIGVTKDISYKHNIKCTACDGSGSKAIDNGCSTCKGAGRVRTQRGNAIFETTCGQCRGHLNHVDCDKCTTNGFVSADTKLSINIPSGAIEGSVLNLGPRGHYIGSVFGADQNTKLSILIHVTPQNGLFIRDNDVICEVKVSLLEAFRGCTKTISTIDGDKEIEIPKLIKNKEEILLPNLGIGRKGNQAAIININYPNNIDALIEVLQKD